MSKETILYCYMNNKFEFTDENGNITEEIEEAAGYHNLEDAKVAKNDFDNPEEWKIVKKRIIYQLEEIIEQ